MDPGLSVVAPTVWWEPTHDFAMKLRKCWSARAPLSAIIITISFRDRFLMTLIWEAPNILQIIGGSRISQTYSNLLFGKHFAKKTTWTWNWTKNGRRWVFRVAFLESANINNLLVETVKSLDFSQTSSGSSGRVWGRRETWNLYGAFGGHLFYDLFL